MINVNMNKLTLKIVSFSYREGIPSDDSGNGGGFVFDCRALPNPGREEKYKYISGEDQLVIDYLSNEVDVNYYFENCKNMVKQSVDNYINRNFSNLMVAFGCTGGQHRSVFLANKLCHYFSSNYDINIVLEHTNKLRWLKQ